MLHAARTALILSLFFAAAGPAHAIDVEVVAPDPALSDAAPEDMPPPSDTGAAADATSSPATSPVETGSISKDAQHPVPDSTADGTTPPAGEPGLGQFIRAAIEAEQAAAEAARPPAIEGEPRRQPTAEERDAEALKAFYGARQDAPVWVSPKGLNAKATALISEVGKLGEWGLDPSAISLPELKGESDAGPDPTREQLVAAERALSMALLKYHLLARGGAIYNAPKELSSYLDRRPQIRDRKSTLEGAAAAADLAQHLVAMHPQQAEFQRLLKAWREAKASPKGRIGKVSADQLLANMQQWRWLPEDLGSFHVFFNVPEYMVRIYQDGEIVFNERATAGLVNKQTPIFSDEIERVTFKSKWRVPDSIKVKEVWPSLLRGGGMMRQFGLVMTRKDSEEPVDWHRIDWSKADMNDYILWQPPGPKNQLGLVKFSFPSKHRVYMHDTPDKHMFAWSRRAVSHGCMRIRNPLQMATIILGRDKGWERARIDDLAKNGPEHNVVELDRKVPVHILYLTVRIDEAGKITTFPDIYGHEKRVRQALAGEWTKIARPSDHLAPLDQTRVPRVAAGGSSRTKALRQPKSLTELMFGGF